MSKEETIAAIATPQGRGGIGVIRISGPLSKQVLVGLWRSVEKPVDKFLTHRFYYGNIGDIDRGLAVWFGAPHSYTGEEVVELHCHGGPAILEALLRKCLEQGARLAEPGEFTKRAYLNRKMDLAQAESVVDLISASSEAGLKQAQEQMSGRLSKVVSELQKEILEIRAFVEATIDFPEEEFEMIERSGVLNRLVPVQKKIGALIESYETGRRFREGVSVVLAGRPNVGKSSLFNALLGSDRSIVHEEPGTTRDVLEESVVLNGILFRLMDVAGLREAPGSVEKIGVEKALSLCEQADFIFWILDGSMEPTKEDFFLRDRLDPVRTLIGFSKSDLPFKFSKSFFEGSWRSESGRSGSWSLTPQTPFSAKEERGLQEIRNAFVERVQKKESDGVGIRISHLRHKKCLEMAKNELDFVKNGVEIRKSAEFLAENLKKVNEYLGQITGAVTTEDLLGEIFGNFCIGK